MYCDYGKSCIVIVTYHVLTAFGLHQKIKHGIAVCIVVSTLGLGLWPRLEVLIEDQLPRKNSIVTATS